ncbi:GH25 family lysozyme [Nocardia sp. NPDC050175]|uniref:GH25 family lysozyme n=1 Tax=Nocardia sp. NPDC050175 TaxID=3364317 RepID=UPI003791B0E6
MRVRSARISTLAAFCVVALVGLLPPSTARADSVVEGLDVATSGVVWADVKNKGVAFTYMKATQGRDSANPAFSELNNGATAAGLFHGGYHVAAPDASAGRDQANFFVDHAGIRVVGSENDANDVKTLPGAILLRDGAKTNKCYGLSPQQMVEWLKEFSNTYNTRSKGWRPVIATTADWWKTCTGDSGEFGSTNYLWLLHSASSADELPTAWSVGTIAQYKVAGPNKGADRFNGDEAALEKFATTVH